LAEVLWNENPRGRSRRQRGVERKVKRERIRETRGRQLVVSWKMEKLIGCWKREKGKIRARLADWEPGDAEPGGESARDATLRTRENQEAS